MDLLYSRTIPGPEFVSLSVLLRGDPAGGDLAPTSCRVGGGGGEPLILSGSLSTVTRSSCLDALTELHFYIRSVLGASGKPVKNNNNNNKANDHNKTAPTKNATTAGRFLREDEKRCLATTTATANPSEKENSDFATQIFRPKKCHGIAMRYHLIRDRKQLSSFLVPLILSASETRSSSSSSSSKPNTPPTGATAGFEMKEVEGVVFCVGVGGGPSAAFGVGTSPLTRSLGPRMKKCLGVLCGKTHVAGKRRNDAPGTRLDLSAARSLLTTLLLTDDEDRMVNAVANGEERVDTNQEDQFRRRIVATSSRKRHNQPEPRGFEGADENPLRVSSADRARIIVERMAVLSVFDSDSMLRKYRNRQAARDALATAKSGKKRLRKFARDADLDGFDFRGEKRSSFASNLDRNPARGVGGKTGSVDDASVSARSTFTAGSNLTLRGPKKDTASRTTTVRARHQTSPGLIASNTKDSGSLNRLGSRRNRRPSAGLESIEGNPSFVSPLRSPPGTVSGRNNYHHQNQVGQQLFDPFSGDQADGGGSAGGSNHARVLVNIALNEDLTCFYKVSKLSSCSVEGVVQIQVKTNTDRGVPFSLLVRDPSNYIQSLQENKKYAEIATDSSPANSDRAFTVSVPKADEYFPVMRYKCGNDLRPVPIRVQTRVRLEEKHWRVALQISSNPHNEDSLTDLTIIMGVPPEVRGESLTTSPPGGVWNSAKRSVIWCVSELGGGEKFQLQARFDIDANETNNFRDGEKPKFPVLVRCQCMYAQLSDIELDVRALPHVMNADVRMKLARRFRLSHRERP